MLHEILLDSWLASTKFTAKSRRWCLREIAWGRITPTYLRADVFHNYRTLRCTAVNQLMVCWLKLLEADNREVKGKLSFIRFWGHPQGRCSHTRSGQDPRYGKGVVLMFFRFSHSEFIDPMTTVFLCTEYCYIWGGSLMIRFNSAARGHPTL